MNRYFIERAESRRGVSSASPACGRFSTTDAGNPSAVTRDYVFDLEAPAAERRLLSVFGGKITTFRRLAEHALDRLKPYFPEMTGPWTERASLPGGDLVRSEFQRLYRRQAPALSLASGSSSGRLRPPLRLAYGRIAFRRDLAR